MTRIVVQIGGALVLSMIASIASADPKAPPKPTTPVTKLNKIDGVAGESVAKKGDDIHLESFAKRSTVRPRDAASGLPTGKRMH